MNGSPVKNGFDPGLIPRKPEFTSQPALSKAWERMFELPFEWVDPGLSEGPVVDFIRTPEVHQYLGAATTRFENSRDWCGATIVPDGGNQFVQIFGEWNVPIPCVPPLDPPRKEYFSATWIGLDGDRRYLDSTLPQVGTQQNVTPGADAEDKQEYYAWFQWWAPHRCKPTIKRITGIHVEGGCHVMGLIWAIDPTHVVVLFRNFAPYNEITMFCEEAPERRHHKGTYHPSISGATAEWIVECPTVELNPTKYPPDLDPFADYKEVCFRHCVAGTAETAGPSTSEKVLTAPRFKRMYRVLSNPSRTRFISMPKRGANTTELIVDYGGFDST
jgi:hypothetical protein